MLPGNWEPAQPSCFFGESFKRITSDSIGFEYKNDAKRFRGGKCWDALGRAGA